MTDTIRKKEEMTLNCLMVVLAVIGTALALTAVPEEGALQETGLENFKFYTVLTNVFCGIVALMDLIFAFAGKKFKAMSALKLGAVCGVTITFAVVAFMFGPLYGYSNFYKNGNLFFHLLLPVTAMVEMVSVRRPKIPFVYTIWAAVPTLLYGIGYAANILINGMGDAWPYSNDFYGFLNWGWGVGIGIFIGVALLAFILAVLFRAIVNRRSQDEE